ncbi:GH21614, partial [Drosophila grimshawi]
KNMEALNDYVVIRILSFLDLKSQQIIIGLHPRFYTLMAIVWRSQYKTVSMSLYEANFSNEALRYFFRNICNTVQVLHLKMVSLEQFEELTSNVFPKVHDFRIGTSSRQLLTDSDIPIIIKSFPSLRTFSPQGVLSGKYFADIPLLERLTLTYCKRFCVQNLQIIMKTHKLKEIKMCLFDERTIRSSNINLPPECMENLESIKIELEELAWFSANLSELKCLKEFILCGTRGMAPYPLICRKLRGLILNQHLNILETCNTTHILGTVIRANLQVDSLKIVTDNSLFHDIAQFRTEDYANIKKLYLKSSYIEKSAYLNSLMYNIGNLELVSFEQCVFGFDNYEFVASAIAEKRTKPLQVNIYQNSCLQTVRSLEHY